MKRSTVFVIIAIVLLLALGALYVAYQKKQAEDRGEQFSYRAFLGLGTRTPRVDPDGETPTDRPGTPDIPEPGEEPEQPGQTVQSRFVNNPFSPSPSTLPDAGSFDFSSGFDFGQPGDFVILFPTDGDDLDPDDGDGGDDGDDDGGDDGRGPTEACVLPEIQFTAEELERLQILLARFYRLAPDLYSDANVQLEEQNRTYFQQIVANAKKLSTSLSVRKNTSSYTGARNSTPNKYYVWSASSGLSGPDASYILGSNTGVDASEQELKDFETQFQIW